MKKEGDTLIVPNRPFKLFHLNYRKLLGPAGIQRRQTKNVPILETGRSVEGIIKRADPLFKDNKRWNITVTIGSEKEGEALKKLFKQEFKVIPSYEMTDGEYAFRFKHETGQTEKLWKFLKYLSKTYNYKTTWKLWGKDLFVIK